MTTAFIRGLIDTALSSTKLIKKKMHGLPGRNGSLAPRLRPTCPVRCFLKVTHTCLSKMEILRVITSKMARNAGVVSKILAPPVGTENI